MTDRNRFVNPAADREPISDSQVEDLIKLQSALLSAAVSNENSVVFLDQLCQFAEKLTSGALASVMLLDNSGQRLFVHSAPSLPAEAIADLDGLKVGEGSCGNAVFYNEDMYVCDTRNDARWENLQDFARRYNVKACWSSPVRNTANQPVGSFALSSFTTRTPDNFQRRLLNSCASIAGIILQREEVLLERKKHEKQLWEKSHILEVIVNSITDGVISTDSKGNIILINKSAEKLTGWVRERAIGQNLDVVFNIINQTSGREIVCNPSICINDINKHPCKEQNIILLSANGKKYDVTVDDSVIKNNSGAANGAVISFRDVSQQRRNREGLLATQQ